MTELEKTIGYEFNNRDLLMTALTHSSYANEHNTDSNERLEFLGDAVLSFVSAEYIFSHDKELSEGKMSNLRSECVGNKGLSKAGEKINLGDFIRFSHGEIKCGGKKNKAIIEDAVEALIAAIYLDSGIDDARKFIMNHVLSEMDFTDTANRENYKGLLQEYVQNDGLTVEYRTVSQKGPDHDKSFEVEVLIEGKEMGRAEGKSKKEAERLAAKIALERLNDGKK